MPTTTRRVRMAAPTFFKRPADFRKWLEKHHATDRELLVGVHKKGSGEPSITWPESVDEALCFGWIDGIRRSLGTDRYTIRFTPRKKGSIWSAANTRRAQELIELGRMRPAGLRAFEARTAERSGVYSFEQREAARLDGSAEKRFRSNGAAWTFFTSQPSGYRKIAVFWVVSAKRGDTRERRLQTLIADSAAGQRIKPLRRATPPGQGC
ncbi:MAG TPA: YdeI/OmpD-associated family protein [Gemmatimonadaceae bacterium]